MNGDFKSGDWVKVRYTGKRCYEFDENQICEAGFLRKDPLKKWLVIKGRENDEEFAFPRDLFELVEILEKH